MICYNNIIKHDSPDYGQTELAWDIILFVISKSRFFFISIFVITTHCGKARANEPHSYWK